MNEFLIYRSSMIFQLAFLLLFLPLTKQKWKVIMGTDMYPLYWTNQ